MAPDQSSHIFSVFSDFIDNGFFFHLTIVVNIFSSKYLICLSPYFSFSYLPWFKIFYELLNRISDLKRANEVIQKKFYHVY